MGQQSWHATNKPRASDYVVLHDHYKCLNYMHKTLLTLR